MLLTNKCSYSNCGRIFSSLPELIQHIEGVHIDFDPQVVENNEKNHPQMVPLSYILRYDYNKGVGNHATLPEEMSKEAKKNEKTANSKGINASKRNNEAENSGLNCCKSSGIPLTTHDNNDSSEHDSFLGVYHKFVSYDGNNNKPFMCLMPGCRKRYKNINGIKYHTKNGHKFCPKPKKDFACFCGKRYKKMHSLEAHSMIHHEMPPLPEQQKQFAKKKSSNKPPRTAAMSQEQLLPYMLKTQGKNGECKFQLDYMKKELLPPPVLDNVFYHQNDNKRILFSVKNGGGGGSGSGSSKMLKECTVFNTEMPPSYHMNTVYCYPPVYDVHSHFDHLIHKY